MMGTSPKIEKAVKFFAYLEFAFSLMSIAGGIWALVVVSKVMNEPRLPPGNPSVKDDTRKVIAYMGIVAIKLIYLIILFFITEAALALFLLRSVHTRNMGHLRLWMVGAGIYTILYLTDFISTIHAISLFEDMSVTLGIFVKIPLLLLVWRFYSDLSKNGTTFVNEI